MIKRMFAKYICQIRLFGVAGCFHALYGKFRTVRADSYSGFSAGLVEKRGVEIGGPSRVFSADGFFPVYPLAAALDNVTYASSTIWEGELSRDREYHFNVNRPPGRQFILDATDLNEIADDSYDFLLSSHVLEHLANPLRGLFEWRRVIREGGLLVLVLPHKDGTFDHLRQVTSFEHMILDYTEGVGEDDATHVEEVLQYHDLKCDGGVSSPHEFSRRIRNNISERSMHHHVFSTRTAAQLLDYCGFEIVSLEALRPCHIVAIAMKMPGSEVRDNKRFIDPAARIYSNSPFPTDRSEK